MRHNISSDALIPKLPNPKELEPFPKQISTVYDGHTRRIRYFNLELRCYLCLTDFGV